MPRGLLRVDDPLPAGDARIAERGVSSSGIIHAIRNGSMWRDAPAGYGLHKTLCNRFILWSRIDVFDRIFAMLPAKNTATDTFMIPLCRLHAIACRATDAIHLKAQCSATGLLKKGVFRAVSVAPGAVQSNAGPSREGPSRAGSEYETATREMFSTFRDAGQPLKSRSQLQRRSSCFFLRTRC